MSIYIKGMEMPTSCYKCQMRRRDGMDMVCPVAHERFSVADVNILEYRLDNCPLVPVPDHGRLIEDCAVKNKIANQYLDNEFARGWNAAMKQCYEAVEDAPTIIPGEEGEG